MPKAVALSFEVLDIKGHDWWTYNRANLYPMVGRGPEYNLELPRGRYDANAGPLPIRSLIQAVTSSSTSAILSVLWRFALAVNGQIFPCMNVDRRKDGSRLLDARSFTLVSVLAQQWIPEGQSQRFATDAARSRRRQPAGNSLSLH